VQYITFRALCPEGSRSRDGPQTYGLVVGVGGIKIVDDIKTDLEEIVRPANKTYVFRMVLTINSECFPKQH
jgi:hypothetical protein